MTTTVTLSQGMIDTAAAELERALANGEMDTPEARSVVAMTMLRKALEVQTPGAQIRYER